MTKTVYVDILFIINFIINYLILFATGNLMTLQIKRIRLILSSVFGAVYAVFAFLPALSFLMTFFGKLISAFIIILIAFGRKNILRSYLIFLVCSCVFAGLLLLLSIILPKSFIEISGGVYYIHISFPLLMTSSAVSYILLKISFSRRGSESLKSIKKVTVKNGDCQITIPTLLDTGNSLSAPFTNARVLISDYNTLSEILPEKAKEILSGTDVPFSLLFDKLSDIQGFCLIPYKTIGVDFSLLLAYRPESIMLGDEILKNALCAISEVPVSDGSGYIAII